jgi:hypothetical protein
MAAIPISAASALADTQTHDSVPMWVTGEDLSCVNGLPSFPHPDFWAGQQPLAFTGYYIEAPAISLDGDGAYLRTGSQALYLGKLDLSGFDCARPTLPYVGFPVLPRPELSYAVNRHAGHCHITLRNGPVFGLGHPYWTRTLTYTLTLSDGRTSSQLTRTEDEVYDRAFTPGALGRCLRQEHSR